MSSIEKFYTTSFTIKRQEWSGDSSALTTSSTFSGHIQQSSDKRYIEELGLRFSNSYTIWCATDTDIQEGDTIVQGSNTYLVRIVVNRNIGDNAHLEVIVEKPHQ